MNSMRTLVIQKLTQFIEDSGDVGIPTEFDCHEACYLTDPQLLQTMDDEELLEAYTVCVGFNG